MMPGAAWQPLGDALRRRADDGLSTTFWLRDDDAVEPTPALDRLLGTTRRNGVPVLLAAIPAFAGPALASRLETQSHVLAGVHGWSHANHAAPDEKKQELGPHRPADTILTELAAGHRRLSAAFGTRFVPVLVPPWNRIDPALAERLPALGFEALSAFGTFQADGLPAINSTVDIMDWKDRKGRPADDLVSAIVRQIEAVPRVPVGVLSHHLVHDEPAWRFLEELFAATCGRPGVTWASFRTLADDARSKAATVPR